MIPEAIQQLVGRKYTFQEDESTIEVLEIKRGDEDIYRVHYITVRGHGIPQKFVMNYVEFINTYGHLFP